MIRTREIPHGVSHYSIKPTKGTTLKHILLATVAVATLSTTAFANPVSTAICSGHSEPAVCEQAIEALADQAEQFKELNRAIYDTGFGSFESLVEAANTPVEVPVEVIKEVEVIVEVEVDADMSDIISAQAKGKEEGYALGIAAGNEDAFSNGHDTGYAAGIAASQSLAASAAEVAFADGSAAGYAEGYEVGVVEGDVVGRELNRLLGDAIASYNVDDMKTYFNNPTDFVHSVYGQVANANEATANAQASADKAVAEANKTVSALKAKIKEMSAKMAKFERSAKHVVGWVKDYGPQSWIAEQANRLFKNLI